MPGPPSTLPATTWAFDDGLLFWQEILDHCADMNATRPSYTHTAAPVLGPRAVTLGGGGEYRPVG